jgi:hypothetical protein
MFKDLKRVSLETAAQHQQFRLIERLHNKPFGYGILKNTGKKTSKQWRLLL